MKHVYYFDHYSDGLYYDNPNGLNVGDPVLVYSKTRVMTGKTEWHISNRFADRGYPGNMDPSIRRFHGWRGTTNDIHIDAHGVYTVKAVDKVHRREWGEDVLCDRVEIGNVDIKKDED